MEKCSHKRWTLTQKNLTVVLNRNPKPTTTTSWQQVEGERRWQVIKSERSNAQERLRRECVIQVCERRESLKKVFSIKDKRFSLWKTRGFLCGKREVFYVEDEWLCGRWEVLWKTRGSVEDKRSSAWRMNLSKGFSPHFCLSPSHCAREINN